MDDNEVKDKPDEGSQTEDYDDAELSDLDISCLICYEVYEEPVVLDCEHIFCKKCSNAMSVREFQCAIISCPLCRSITPFSDHRPLKIDQDLWDKSKEYTIKDSQRTVRIMIEVPPPLREIVASMALAPPPPRLFGIFPIRSSAKETYLRAAFKRVISDELKKLRISALIIARDEASTGKSEFTCEVSFDRNLKGQSYKNTPLAKSELVPVALGLIIRGRKAVVKMAGDALEDLMLAEAEDVERSSRSVCCGLLLRA